MANFIVTALRHVFAPDIRTSSLVPVTKVSIAVPIDEAPT